MAESECVRKSAHRDDCRANGLFAFGRYPFAARGPHFNNADFSLFKQIPLPRETHLEFRAEAANLFNTAEFGNPSNTSGFNSIDAANSNQFSTITSFAQSAQALAVRIEALLLISSVYGKINIWWNTSMTAAFKVQVVGFVVAIGLFWIGTANVAQTQDAPSGKSDAYLWNNRPPRPAF